MPRVTPDAFGGGRVPGEDAVRRRPTAAGSTGSAKSSIADRSRQVHRRDRGRAGGGARASGPPLSTMIAAAPESQA
jgi:hypothetical protein